VSGVAWTPEELKKLLRLYEAKPEWMTDYQMSVNVSEDFGRTPESIRWQLRQFHREVTTVSSPKILLLDIETLPIEALVWDVWKQNVYMEQIKKDWSILCWSAKWLFDSKVMGQCVTPQEAIDHDDRSVLPRVWELMNQAEIIVTHNGDNFDIKKLNARFFTNGFPKPMYFKSIDTKKIATDNFALTYNKLDWIAQIVGIGRKIETDFKWWKECEKGDTKYLGMMLKYNKMDVHLEEEVYLKLRPWMEKHPNIGLHNVGNIDACPTCGSLNLHWKGTYSTALGLYQAFRCEDCGAIGRSTKKAHKLNGSNVQS
jgi:hypothetical protein